MPTALLARHYIGLSTKRGRPAVGAAALCGDGIAFPSLTREEGAVRCAHMVCAQVEIPDHRLMTKQTKHAEQPRIRIISEVISLRARALGRTPRPLPAPHCGQVRAP